MEWFRHDRILSDPDRELAYASVTTVLRRLADKGWLTCDRHDRAFRWRPLTSRAEAHMLQAHEQLHRLLAIGNPDVVAAFVDDLDGASLDQLEAIAQRLKAARPAKEVVWSVWQGWRSLQAISTYPSMTLHNTSARLLHLPALFAAQIGFWRSHLVLSQGLLDTLTPTQLKAVITHELAHVHYCDTFWFFWLGCVRRVTGWLPYTETIWKELLLLRELRADSWAAQRVEPLVLAESLLEVVKAPLTNLALHCAVFGPCCRC